MPPNTPLITTQSTTIRRWLPIIIGGLFVALLCIFLLLVVWHNEIQRLLESPQDNPSLTTSSNPELNSTPNHDGVLSESDQLSAIADDLAETDFTSSNQLLLTIDQAIKRAAPQQ